MLHTKEYTKSDYYKAMSITEIIIVANSASFPKSVIFFNHCIYSFVPLLYVCICMYLCIIYLYVIKETFSCVCVLFLVISTCSYF